MNAHRIETTVNPDGTLLLKGIPFQPGEQVEVIIIERQHSSDERPNRYSLRGKPVQYDAPFEPIAEGEWNATR